MKKILFSLFFVTACVGFAMSQCATPGMWINPNNGRCQDCPAGYYCPGDDARYPCPVGTYNGNKGASSVGDCTDCPAGTSTRNRDARRFCIDCKVGTYQDQTGQGDCIDCPSGTYNPNTGAASLAACADCPQGTYGPNPGMKLCRDCNYGTAQFQEGQTDCINCGPGTFQDTKGQISCQICPPGTAGPNPKNRFCRDCNPGTYQPNYQGQVCIKCAPGTYQDETNALSCKTCPVNTYQNQIGKSSCNACPVGFVSPAGSDHINDCVPGPAPKVGPDGQMIELTSGERFEQSFSLNNTSASGKVTLANLNGIEVSNIMLFNMSGGLEKIWNVNAAVAYQDLEVNEFATGIYVLRVNATNGEFQAIKFFNNGIRP